MGKPLAGNEKADSPHTGLSYEPAVTGGQLLFGNLQGDAIIYTIERTFE